MTEAGATFEPTEAQRLLQASVRKVFSDHPDAEAWPTLARMGLPAIAIPSKLGGGGGSALDALLVLEEAGRALGPEALFGTVLAGWLVGTGPGAQPVVDEIVAGRLVTATTDSELVAERRGPDQLVLQGVARWVPGGSDAALLVAPADVEGRTAIVAIDLAAETIIRERHGHVDATRRFEQLKISELPLTPPAVVEDGERALACLVKARKLGALAIAADAVGAADAALELAVSYAGQREQFGTPIGAFQAVKHMLVDAHVAIEVARASVYYAAWCSDTDAEEGAYAGSAAKALASDAYALTARHCVQTHGGIGFTADVPAHLHVKRALLNDHLFGSAAHHRERIVGMLMSGEAPAPQW